jgi:hypothetical protein
MVVLRVAAARAYYDATAAPPWLRLAEPAADPLSEAELSRIWAGQCFPAGALQAVDGRSLRILNPGRAGGAAGPDFLDAVFEIGGEQRHGDVELHVRASAWRGHGHDADPAYDGVALHVVYRADEGAATRLHSGASAPVAAFAPWLEGRTEELQRWLTARPLWREPCRDARARLGDEAIDTILLAAGRRRFEDRAEALGRQVEELGADEALWRALFDILGVGGDRAGFRRLAAAFPVGLARRLIAGVGTESGVSTLAAGLCFVAGLSMEPPCPAFQLPLRLRPALGGRGRPANRPQLRLEAMAALFGRAGGKLAAYVDATVAGAETPSRLVPRWQATRDGRSLLGAGRAREVVINVVLPFAATRPETREPALRLAEAMPAAEPYGNTRFLETNLGLPGGKRPVKGAFAQQGLLGLLNEWCSRGGCGRCPLS